MESILNRIEMVLILILISNYFIAFIRLSQARAFQKELIDLLNDLATMIGESFDD